MSRRRARRVLALLCLSLGAVVGVLPAPSSAEAPQATGWWSRRIPFQAAVEGQSVSAPVAFRAVGSPSQLPPVPTEPTVPGGPVTTVPLPVPVPTIPAPPVPLPEDPGPATPNPSVPDGGLWVANDPAGPVAISALRYRGDIGAGDLNLRFAPGSTTVGPVVACPALSEFTPGPQQPWPDRPAHDCARLSLSGRLTPDGTGLQFTIPQGFVPFGERVLDIVLLPAPTSGDPFSLYFEPPDESSLEVTQGQQLPAPVAELPDPDPLELPTPLPDVDTSFASGDIGDVSLPAQAPETAATPTAEVAAPAARPSPIADVFAPFTESRFGRIVAVALLLGMAGGLWFFGGAETRAPRLLGALAGDAPVLVDQVSQGRGIGRFRRERGGLPNRL